MSRSSEDFEKKPLDESSTEKELIGGPYTSHGLPALLGGVVLFFALSGLVITGYSLFMRFFHWLKGSVFRSELPVEFIIGAFFFSCCVFFLGYLLARNWPFVAYIGLAVLLTLSGLEIIPGAMYWKISFLLQIIPGVALFIFALWKRDALRYAVKKEPHKDCSCAACRQATARPLSSASVHTGAEGRGPGEDSV